MVIVHIVEPFASGVAHFVKSLTEAMPDDVHIVVHGERKEEIPAEEVKKNFHNHKVRFIKWRSAKRSIDPLKDISALIELSKILRKLKAKEMLDAVHLHSSKSGLLGRLACRIVGIKNVFYTPNGASFLSAKNKFTRFLYKQAERVGNMLGGNVVCCSASELEEYLRLGINASYINNGINVNPQVPVAADKQGDIFTIVTSGRIEKQKNPALFNEIAAYFADMPQFRFVWIGDGSFKKVLTAKNITVTGWLPNKDVRSHVNNSDIYLSTSTYEGLSFAVLEALSLHKPVLLSNCTGNTDLVKRGVNGDLFRTKAEAVSKVLQFYNNPEMLNVMGRLSGEICKTEFNVKKNFKEYRRLYAGGLLEQDVSAKWSFG
jgi:glycosyltransferase involved in cell wall biosynthesis